MDDRWDKWLNFYLRFMLAVASIMMVLFVVALLCTILKTLGVI